MEKWFGGSAPPAGKNWLGGNKGWWFEEEKRADTERLKLSREAEERRKAPLLAGMQAAVNFDPEVQRQTIAKRLVASGMNEAAAYSGAARTTNTSELQNVQTLNALAQMLARYRAGVRDQADSIPTTDNATAFLAGMG